MKTKIIATATILCIGLSSALTAADSTKMNTEELERFFYEKGYNDAKNKFYEKGYRDALKFAERKLNEYRAKIKALEQGKYLLKKDKITYPEVYQTTDSKGNIKVVIGGCKIERPLTPSDIIKLPVIDQRVCEDYNPLHADVHYAVDGEKSVNEPSVSNSVFLSDRGDLDLPKKTSDETKIVYKYFPNTQFYRNLLEKAGILYSIYGEKLKALFDSREEARKFCRLYRLKEGKDCL